MSFDDNEFDRIISSAKKEILNAITINKKTQEKSLSIGGLMPIYELPEELWELTHLTALDISHLGLAEIPHQIKKLSNLKRLNADANALKELPPEIGSLTNLTNLDIDDNSISSLPLEFKNLQELYHFSCKENDLNEFPIELTFLKKLNCIHISDNSISSIPDEIINLEKLQLIDLKNNEIEEFPIALTQLKNLKELNLSENMLHCLPDEIGSLRTIEALHLGSNNINSIPPSISNLKKLKIFPIHTLPLADMPELHSMGIVEAIRHLETLAQVGEFTAFWKVPKPLVTAFKQYLSYFSEFVRELTSEEISFEILSTDDGLKIVTNPTEKISIESINSLLEDYISQKSFEPSSNQAKEAQFRITQLIRDYEFQINQLNAQIANQADRMQYLGDKVLSKDEVIKKLELSIQFFQSTHQQVLQLIPDMRANKADVHVYLNAPTPAPKVLQESFDSDHFLKELIEITYRMAERKVVKEIENNHNTNLCDWLRTKNFSAYDQTLSGVSNKTYGELDIMIRECNGTPVTIVEGLRAKSCTPNNTNISSHVDKLLHKYDTVGHEYNYIVVYAEAEDFKTFWQNYCDYMRDLNNKKGFSGKYQLYSFTDTKIGKKANVKVGLATHDREGSFVYVYHIVVDMYC